MFLIRITIDNNINDKKNKQCQQQHKQLNNTVYFLDFFDDLGAHNKIEIK